MTNPNQTYFDQTNTANAAENVKNLLRPYTSDGFGSKWGGTIGTGASITYTFSNVTGELQFSETQKQWLISQWLFGQRLLILHSQK